MHRLSAAIIATALVVLALSGTTAGATPRNVLLARGRTEPVVAVDPLRPNVVVVGSNTNYAAPVGNTLPTASFVSADGGRSFVAGTVPVIRPYTTGADPTVQIDQDGTVFYSYLGETPSYCSGGHSAVVVTHSIDGGRSWRGPGIVDTSSADDKPNLAVESVPGRLSHLFLTWTRWYNHLSEIWYARSLDGGQTFSRPALLYGSSLDNFGSVPVIGPDHRVYVFWSVFPAGSLSTPVQTRLFLRVSRDDGRSFAAARSVIGPFWSIPRMVAPGSLRNLTMPAVAVGRNGVLFLAWASVSHSYGGGVVRADIDLSRSRNAGLSWDTPRRVNDVARGDRFMPAMSVLPDGSVGLAFYDRRASPWNLDVYAVRATFAGGFRVSRNVRVTQGTAPISDIYYIAPGSTCFSPGRFFGDYIGTSAARGSSLCVVWADTQLHASDQTDLWFARVRLPGVAARRRGR